MYGLNPTHPYAPVELRSSIPMGSAWLQMTGLQHEWMVAARAGGGSEGRSVVYVCVERSSIRSQDMYGLTSGLSEM